MLSHSKSKKPEVVISRGNTPKESLIKGIEQLGGISKFISEGDHVFVKFNLNLPGGFPINTNFDVLEALIVSCKEAGEDKVYLGSFPLKGIPIKIISDLYDLKEHFKTFGADLIFLDNSDNFYPYAKKSLADVAVNICSSEPELIKILNSFYKVIEKYTFYNLVNKMDKGIENEDIKKILKKTKTLVFISCEISNDKEIVVSASGTWKIL